MADLCMAGVQKTHSKTINCEPTVVSRNLLPEYDQLNEQIRRLALSVDAPELHGALCGFLAGGGAGNRDNWLEQVLPGSGAASPEPDSPLDALFVASLGQLDDLNMGLQLLLPEDDRPVSERTGALLLWCRGFLGGFGLSGRDVATLSEEGAEALADLGHIAASRIDHADPEEDDSALSEISEYVRIAAIALFEECVESSHRRLH